MGSRNNSSAMQGVGFVLKAINWLSDLDDAIGNISISIVDIEMMRKICSAGGKIIFIGNGGSASIASHMAEDYSKNGKLRAIAFNDASLLTCMANDYGYENMFSQALDIYADPGDMLIAISSSGKSPNIINACKKAKEMGLKIVTLSGFSPDNPLRKLGDSNHWVSSDSYGIVEITHLAILHGMLDTHCEDK